MAHRSDLDPWRPSPGVDRCHHESLQRDSKNAADTDPIPLEVNVCKTVKVTCTWLDIVLGAFSLNHGIGTPGTFDTRSQGIGPRKSGNSVAAHRRWEGVCSNSLSLSLRSVWSRHSEKTPDSGCLFKSTCARSVPPETYRAT